jgi:long-chain acyl-CoA synthetase
VAIVVPNQELLVKYSQERGWHGTFEQLCERKEVNSFILKEMDKIADEVNLLGFERVKAIYLEHVSMVLNGVCTPSLKIKRKEAKTFYSSVIKQLYKGISKN